jgi:hypothetical protein
MSEANKKVALDFLAAMDVGDGDAMDRCLTRDAFTTRRALPGSPAAAAGR